MRLATGSRRRCAVCGEPHATCGGESRSFPALLTKLGERTVAQLKRYTVTVNGYRTVLMLDEAGAATYADAVPLDEPADAAPADEQPQPKARKRTSNKSRTPVDKQQQ